MTELIKMVSVCMITYNHEKFIRQAIDNMLIQVTNFEYELVIADDNSPDKTHEIISEYISHHPKGHLINYLCNEKNVGAMQNFLGAVNNCTGKYIALCEGDDYWTDPYKLQNQVDFLEANQDVNLCFHNAEVCYENDNRPSHQFSEIKKGYYTGKQIIENWIIPTASVVFRNAKIEWPKFYNTAVHGDILLFLLLAEKGKIYGFEETWCIYRKNNCSITNSNYLNITYNRKVVAQLINMKYYFQTKYNEVFSNQIIKWKYVLMASLYHNNKYHFLIIEIIKFAINHPVILLKKIKSKISIL